ncbi:Uncharacterised protein [Segatella copri]|nr:Uncharacterised protein [Segatella copri]
MFIFLPISETVFPCSSLAVALPLLSVPTKAL